MFVLVQCSCLRSPLTRQCYIFPNFPTAMNKLTGTILICGLGGITYIYYLYTLSNDAHSTVQINIRETDGAIQNGQSKEIGNIGHPWHELFAPCFVPSYICWHYYYESKICWSLSFVFCYVFVENNRERSGSH